MLALSMAFVGATVPKEKTGSAMGLLGTMSAVGTALGPSLGGMLISGPGWQAIFMVNIPLGALALLLAYRFMPADRPRQEAGRTHFDTLGTLLLAATLAAYALAMTIGRGRFETLNAGLLLVALVGMGIFLFAEARVAAPLIRLAMFRDPLFSAGFTMSALVSTVLMATLVVGPFYLSRGLGLAPAFVGLVMSIGPVIVALTGVPAGRIVDRIGTHRVTMFGLLGITVGAYSLSMSSAAFGILGYIAPIVVITAGYALFQTANNTAVMKDVPLDRRGVVSGLLNLSRNLGLMTGASVMGAVFALGSGASDIAVAGPEDVAAGLRLTFAVAAALIALALAVAVGSLVPSRPTVSPDRQRSGPEAVAA
jgi:MFS family permease